MLQTNASGSERLRLLGPDSSNTQFRMMEAIHKSYARSLGSSLSAFLQADVAAELIEISTVKTSGFIASITGPSCLMMFRLRPLQHHVFLHMDCGTVFPLLELLLGGKSDALSAVAPRNLTDVEWSLLEEIVQVMLRPLGEAWLSFASVEFEVDSLVSEPGLLPVTGTNDPFFRFTLKIRLGNLVGQLEIVAPEVFFNAGPRAASQTDAANGETEQEHSASPLNNALIDLEVVLDGPTVPLRDLLGLNVNRVLQLAYPLDRPLRGVLNQNVSLKGRIVSTGQKRGFRVTDLPQPAN